MGTLTSQLDLSPFFDAPPQTYLKGTVLVLTGSDAVGASIATSIRDLHYQAVHCTSIHDAARLIVSVRPQLVIVSRFLSELPDCDEGGIAFARAAQLSLPDSRFAIISDGGAPQTSPFPHWPIEWMQSRIMLVWTICSEIGSPIEVTDFGNERDQTEWWRFAEQMRDTPGAILEHCPARTNTNTRLKTRIRNCCLPIERRLQQLAIIGGRGLQNCTASKRLRTAGPYILASVLLIFAAVGRWPYWFFTLVRLTVFLTACYAAMNLYASRRVLWTWTMIGTGLLFNPLVPVNMKRSDWAPVDILASALLAACAAVQLSRPLERECSPKH